MEILRFQVCETELGWVAFTLTEVGLRSITLPRPTRESALSEVMESDAVPAAEADVRPIAESIQAIVSGRPVKRQISIDWTGITSFRRGVLEACASIPAGETRSYAWLAQQVGKPAAARAAGRVMATNPWPLLIPCHRVVGSSGRLHGYGGGLDMKAKLLAAEGATV